VIRPNGTLGAPLPLPDGAFVAGFSPDGRQVYVSVYPPRPPDQPQARPAQTWSAVDVATNAVTPLDNRPAAMARDAAKPQIDALPVRLAASMGQARRETTAQNLRSVWLEVADPKASNEPRALVTPDCDQGVLSDVRGSYDRGSAGPDRAAYSALLLPDASAVLYRSGDALFAVPLRRYPKAAFLDARRRAQQAAAMSNAKQIGVALMMYTQDYDETLPVANEGFMDQVSPYLADRDLFNNPATGAPGFVYTHSGGLLSAIMNPGEFSIGYLIGPGGRAILFADGHVVWQPD
jgi:prepilin-type processing-associated H-X9-DG protein